MLFSYAATEIYHQIIFRSACGETRVRIEIVWINNLMNKYLKNRTGYILTVKIHH